MGIPLFGQEHVDRYRETDGEEGDDWQGSTVLLLVPFRPVTPEPKRSLVAGCARAVRRDPDERCAL